MSYKSAVVAKCKECIYDPKSGAGTWRQQVEACTSYSCPLFDYRPKSIKRGSTDPSESAQDLTDFHEPSLSAVLYK